MEIINDSYYLSTISNICEKFFDEKTLFFDIECTGLSPRSSFVYLIGCAKRTGNKIELTQFFANGYDDERELLNAFNDYLDDFDTLLGFNSTRFDEGFLIERFKKYQIDSKLKSKRHIDLYLTTTKAKPFLALENYKQKTIERFLDLDREDQYNGGELIPIYNEYSENRDPKKKELVLLHNIEDVKGMIHIIDILAYVELLNCELTSVTFEIDNDCLRASIESSVTVPKPINKIRDYGLYMIKENQIHLSLKLFTGELKTWLDDYKNYYYLLNEDIIIPKALADAVDKENKRKATRADCYIKKEGSYIQIPKSIVLPTSCRIFKPDYKSDLSFIDINDINEDILKKIALFMLKH